jgi:hypothetical protein
MKLHWLPWKFLIKRAARAYGVLDPLTLLARLRKFSQPSEVQEPVELLRAGIVFHARGLINTRAIQNNLDWVWPYWVERQFNPEDVSFLPRGFAFSHVNLTHRNWTAVGRPDLPLYPIVDPRGMVTPFYDGWSLDFWLIPDRGEPMLPSRLADIHQRLLLDPEPAVETFVDEENLQLFCSVRLPSQQSPPILVIDLRWRMQAPGRLALALRPYNPEGIQFIESITPLPGKRGLRINAEGEIHWDRNADTMVFSNYVDGDVIHRLDGETTAEGIQCPVGMATAAAMFRQSEDRNQRLEVQIPLGPDLRRQKVRLSGESANWDGLLADAARLRIPDVRMQFLYEAALRTLVLLSADEAVPGPYTYRRFWFRDACFMVHAMLSAGLIERCRRILAGFFQHQERSGYFRSQQGEWDSNGQVLWILDRFQQATDAGFENAWMQAVQKGAEWICRKRRSNNRSGPYAGLFPAGFSAEHFGPNDYYYWDDFWGAAGLQSAARLCGRFLSEETRRKFAQEAEDFEATIAATIEAIPDHRSRGGIPAAPLRRMDSGAVGSLVADYPLQITGPGDRRIMNTVAFLMQHCFHGGGFFQDMIHSGINAYLTLAVAQTLLRAGDDRYRELIDSVARLASDTGQWPEAIHPRTEGGCMGDGQHGWAASEWVLAMRALFLREEGRQLLIGSGVFPEWLAAGNELEFGPSPTRWGPVSVRISVQDAICRVLLDARWHDDDNPPDIEIALPGYEPKKVREIDAPVELKR